MPSGTLTSVQSDIKAGTPSALYLIVGDDERGKDEVVHAFDALVSEDIRPFNYERLSALDTDPATIVAIAQTLPLLGDRRVVVVTRAEKWLTGRKKGKSDDDGGDEESGAESGADGASSSRGADRAADAGAGIDGAAKGAAGRAGESGADRGGDVFANYIESPSSSTVVVLVASDINRTTRLAKLLLKQAVVIECWGLKGEKELRGQGITDALDRAGRFVAAAVRKAGMTIDRTAVAPLIEHAGTDIATLRGDVERLLLYCQGQTVISVDDVRAVVGGATLVNAWGVINAIERNDVRESLRQLRLLYESGAVPYMVLGQLAWFVRSRLPMVSPGRVAPAVEAVFRTDVAMKSSGGEPQVLLERLIVELCAAPARRSSPARR